LELNYSAEVVKCTHCRLHVKDLSKHNIYGAPAPAIVLPRRILPIGAEVASTCGVTWTHYRGKKIKSVVRPLNTLSGRSILLVTCVPHESPPLSPRPLSTRQRSRCDPFAFLNSSNAEAMQAVYPLTRALVTARPPFPLVHVSQFKVVSLHGRVQRRRRLLSPLFQARPHSQIGKVSRASGYIA